MHLVKNLFQFGKPVCPYPKVKINVKLAVSPINTGLFEPLLHREGGYRVPHSVKSPILQILEGNLL